MVLQEFVVGILHILHGELTLEGCYSVCSFDFSGTGGDFAAGGLVGSTESGIRTDVGYIAWTHTILKSCYSVCEFVGSVPSDISAAYGALFGRTNWVEVSDTHFGNWTNIYWGVGVDNTSTDDFNYGLTRAEFNSSENWLNTTYFTNDTKGINNGFPILKWELEIEE